MRRLPAAVALLLLAACDLTTPWTATAGSTSAGGNPSAPTGTLAVLPASLQVTAVPNGLAPPQQSLTPTIDVRGGTPSTTVRLALAFSGDAVAHATWASAPGGGPVIDVTFPAPGPTAGVRHGAVTVSACFDDACTLPLLGSPVTVSISYTSEAGLAASPASVAATWTRGDPAPSLPSILLSEPGVTSGLATASVTYVGASGWLVAGGAPIPGAGSLSCSPAGLPAGAHRATVRYTGATAAKYVEVPVTLTVVEPLVTASPGALGFTAVSGYSPPADQRVTLTAGAVAVTYLSSVQYGPGATGWLTVPAMVTPPQEIPIAPNSAALAAGTYTAEVRFSGADGLPRGTLAVTYTVVAMTLADPADVTLTVTPATQAGDLAGTTPVTVSAGPALAWTAQGDVPWLVLDTAAGTTGQAIAWHVNPAILPAMHFGAAEVARVTVTTAGPALSQSFTVLLRHMVPEVRFVAPSVQPAGQAARVRVRGAGFSTVTDFGAFQLVEGLAATVTRLSDTALLVDLPAAAAGARAVRVPNALGLASATRLHHVAPVASSYQKVAQSGSKKALLLDARRNAALAVNADAGQVVRFSEAGGAWSAAVRAVAGIQDLGLSPDGELLVAVTSTQLRLLDPVTLADVATFTPPGNPTYYPMSESQGLAVFNDGKVLMPAQSGWGSLTTFDLVTRLFGPLAVDIGVGYTSLYGGPWSVASRDGERALIVQSAGLSPAPPLLYADATEGVARRNPAGLDFFYQASLADDGSRFILHASRVYDGSFGQVGQVVLPASHPLNPGAVMSPDGQRAYVLGYVSAYLTAGIPARVFVVDTSAPPVAGATLPILRSFDVPGHVSCLTDTYGCQYRVQLAVTPDETTLLVLGQQGLLVVPIPPP